MAENARWKIFAVLVVLGMLAFPSIELCTLLADGFSFPFAIEKIAGDPAELIFGDLLALIPFLILAIISYILQRKPGSKIFWTVYCGLFAILAFMIHSYVGIWDEMYALNHGHISSTIGLAFVFIPVIATFTMLLGLAFGWFTSWQYRRFFEGVFDKPHQQRAAKLFILVGLILTMALLIFIGKQAHSIRIRIELPERARSISRGHP